jgi:error-prone DNA polymerase
MDEGGHVLDFYRPVLDALRVTPTAELAKQRRNTRVMLAGVKVASGKPRNHPSRPTLFLTLDDGSGSIELAVFEETEGCCAWIIGHAWLLGLRATVRGTGTRGISLSVERAWDLTALAREHEAGTLDVDALWTDGVAEIDAKRRGRRPPMHAVQLARVRV